MSSFKDLMSATEDILGGVLQPKTKHYTPTGAEAKRVNMEDLRGIHVSDSLVESFISGSFPTVKPAHRQKEVIEEDSLNEDDLERKITSLIMRLSTLLKEARETLAEMTSVGMIGVNQKFTLHKKKKVKKNGLNKSYQGN